MDKKQWEITKSVYLKWLNTTKLKQLIFKKIIFQGYSLWWSNKILDKDIILDNKWFLDLNSQLNKKKIVVKKNSFFFNLLKSFVKNLLYLLLVKLIFKKKKNQKIKENCYLVIYHNMIKFNNNFIDPRFSFSPLENKRLNSLLVILPFNLNILLNYKKIKNNLDSTKIDYYLMHHYISFKKFFVVYIEIFFLFLKSKKIVDQKNYFILNKIDCSNILKNLFLKSYSGDIQNTIIDALSIKEFLKENKHKKLISYYEFFPGSRAIYFFVRSLRYPVKIISVQHGIYAKNNLFYHLEKNDFIRTGNKNLTSPMPDIFFTSGFEHSKYLKKKIPSSKVQIIGSPKHDLMVRKIKYVKKIKNNLKKISMGKKIVLIITAINDEKYMINFLNKCYLNDVYVIVSPHYCYKEQTMKNFKDMAKFQYTFLNNFSSQQLIFCSDLIIGGMTGISYEALFYNLNIIRVTDYSSPLQSDTSDNIPLVQNNKLFRDYLNNKGKIPAKKIATSIKKLFYKLDKKSYLRLSRALINLNI